MELPGDTNWRGYSLAERDRRCQAVRQNAAKAGFDCVFVPLCVDGRNLHLDCGYRIDLLIDDRLIVELKSVDQLLKIHEAQILTYMKLAAVNVGLLINCLASGRVGKPSPLGDALR